MSKFKIIGPKENLQAPCPASRHFVILVSTPIQPDLLLTTLPHTRIPFAPDSSWHLSHIHIGAHTLLAAWNVLPLPTFLLTNSYLLFKAPFKGHILCEALLDYSHSYTCTPHSSVVWWVCGPRTWLPVRLAAFRGHGPDTE